MYEYDFKTYVTIETARDASLNFDLHSCPASSLADKGQRLEVQCIAALHFLIGLVVCAILRSKLSTAMPEIPEKPHQPLTLSFPEREFSKKQAVKRLFQSSWFKQ